MIAFPEVQRRAQAELDAVVGRDRLPTIADAPRLPYVCAIVEEVHCWRPSVPLGLNHASTEDDWYEGMFIPKGTVRVGNIWHCNHDRAVFGEGADEFRPATPRRTRRLVVRLHGNCSGGGMSRSGLGGGSA